MLTENEFSKTYTRLSTQT